MFDLRYSILFFCSFIVLYVCIFCDKSKLQHMNIIFYDFGRFPVGARRGLGCDTLESICKTNFSILVLVLVLVCSGLCPRVDFVTMAVIVSEFPSLTLPRAGTGVVV